jgi:23S rRNA pseudouridine1911/1915/1917 synthase
MAEQSLELQVERQGIRLDRYLADEIPELSRSAAQRLIDNGLATVNGESAKASYKIQPGDTVRVALPDTARPALVPEDIPLDVVYEDKDLLVIDKPAGMVIHPAPGHTSGTLVNALLAYCPQLAGGGDDRPGIVHRLDRDTSGLIVAAKNDRTRSALQQQFKDRTVRKAYLALLDGELQPAWGSIQAPIGRDPHQRQRMAVLAGGREATTEYHVLERFGRREGAKTGSSSASGFSLVEAEPKTGRTHQIRVHFASIGHPVAGDAVYGPRRPLLAVPRQFLHAWRLGFKHPRTGERIDLEIPLPPDLSSVLDQLRAAERRTAAAP